MTLNNDDLLVSAAGAGRLSDVRELLEKGANIEARDSDGYTSLHRAAEGGHLEIIRFLIDKGANIGAKNKDGGKPLDVANTSRQSEVVNFLGPKQSEYDRLLFAAVESGNISEVTNLLNIGASIEVKGVENAEFRLARYVKRIMEMSNYHNVHSEKKSELERIKGELPESVKNAVFSSEVCIKSVYYSNEYLYPASDYLSHDRDRRRVFTWRPGGKDSSCQWKFEPEGNNIYIKSTYFNEYLYPAGNGLSHDRDRRRVFTWRPGGKDSSCQWKFEPEDNNIYIKSTYFNEYLYPASDYLSHDRDRRRVFTWRPGAKIVHVNGKLRIVDLLARSVMYNIVLQKKLSVIYLMIMHQTIHRKVTK
ncbi:ankyrin repeat domain-containing protein [Wolbachia pipientis]|uniref:ankyrin repeat domain-containing protein n=1 Tax=Wolbachia pipientis TaxID=955 RepID=UPI001CC25DCF|nr:ankyrin repeat domain-containing protein [Wolbachia pipientis]